MQSSITKPHTVGYISSFVEIFVWLMTIRAYTSLWELLYPTINPYAWGYDLWYDGYAKESWMSRNKSRSSSSSSRSSSSYRSEEGKEDKEIAHRMGIVSDMIVIHQQYGYNNYNNSSGGIVGGNNHQKHSNNNNDNGRTDNTGNLSLVSS